MRRLQKEVNYTPKIFFLKFSHFFIFGIVATLERFFIKDGLTAFVLIIATYIFFILYEKFIPSHWFFYFITKSYYFECPNYLENKNENTDN